MNCDCCFHFWNLITLLKDFLSPGYKIRNRCWSMIYSTRLLLYDCCLYILLSSKSHNTGVFTHHWEAQCCMLDAYSTRYVCYVVSYVADFTRELCLRLYGISAYINSMSVLILYFYCNDYGLMASSTNLIR